MKPGRTLAILNKLKDIHERNPDLFLNDITNQEIIEVLDHATQCVVLLVEFAAELLNEEKKRYD